MTRDADTTLAVLAVLLKSLPGEPMLTYDHKAGAYLLQYGPAHLSNFRAYTLSELAEAGR